MFDINAVMTLCINPKCSQPENPDHHLYCHTCGSELLLEGLYRVSKKLGEGGFGVTYIVKDNYNDIEKVLKILTLDDPNALRLFEQEAEVLKKLNHPGIPQVESDGYFIYFARDSQEPIHCLIMERIEGEDLETWLNKRQKPINQRVALNWLKELTGILQVVHQEQFFHRDIKPSNIILKPDGKLALIDFGTVKEATVTYMEKAEAGKPGTVAIYSENYTPTEQRNGSPVPQSDFFALGRTLVHLLTKQPPLQFYDPHTDSLNWQNTAPNIDPLFKKFIDKLMQRLSKDRPSNTTVILQELEKIETKLYPPIVTPKPTVIKNNHHTNISEKPSINKNKQPSRRVSNIKIPWSWLTFLVVGYGIFGAVSFLINIPWWVCVATGVITAIIMSDIIYYIPNDTVRDDLGAFFLITWVILNAVNILLLTFNLSQFWGSDEYFYHLLAGLICMAIAFFIVYLPLYCTSMVLEEIGKYFSETHLFLILTTTSFGGLGLGILMVWLWQYLI
ncbi:MAG: protein kinase [Crocosphaera sp.]